MKNSPLILAVDTSDLDRVNFLIRETNESIGIYKLGLEFFSAHGPDGVKEVQDSNGDIKLFLDLKLHDIPNTVAKTAESLSDIGPDFLTVHAAGGSKMVGAAVAALPKTIITAVTILTSIDNEELPTLGFKEANPELAVMLATVARDSGARAIVSSPLEVSAIRKALGNTVKIITPGVRIEAGEDDQVRTATPKVAIENGSDFLVIGRPITQARSPGIAAAEILNSIS